RRRGGVPTRPLAALGDCPGSNPDASRPPPAGDAAQVLAPLTHNLVEPERGGDGGVQRRDGAAERELRDGVAALAGKAPQALAFAPDDERDGTAEVEGRERRGRLGGEADDGDSAIAQGNDRLGEVRHARN